MAHVATVVKITDCLKKAGINFLESDSNCGIGVRIKLPAKRSQLDVPINLVAAAMDRGLYRRNCGLMVQRMRDIVTVSSNAG